MMFYLDASACVRYFITKPVKTTALSNLIETSEQNISSVVIRPELIRALRNHDRPIRPAIDFLESIDLVPATDALVEATSWLAPSKLGTLDALHITTALAYLEDVEAFVTYDKTQSQAAADNGLPVVSP